MRAVVVTDQAVEVQDVKKPEPKPNEVLVPVSYTHLTLPTIYSV